MRTMTYYVEVRRILIYGSSLPFIHPDYAYYDIVEVRRILIQWKPVNRILLVQQKIIILTGLFQ